MQSSSRIVKNNSINTNGEAVINTKRNVVIGKKYNVDQFDNIFKNSNDFNSVDYATSLIEEASKEALRIKSKAYNEAVEIEKNAMESGYNEGSKNGFEQGYQDGYNNALLEVQKQEQELLSNALKILEDAKAFKEQYILNCEDSIKDVIGSTINSILKRSLLSDDVLDGIVKDQLRELKKEEEITLYLNQFYYDHINSSNRQWLIDMNSNTILKIVVDNSIELGMMIIEKSDGKVHVNLNGLEKSIEEAIYSE